MPRLRSQLSRSAWRHSNKTPVLRKITPLLFALLFGLMACNKEQSGVCMSVAPRASHTILPPSVEYDPHLWSQNVVMRGIDSSAWDIACRRVKQMGVKRMRMMVMPSWWEPINDNDDANRIAWDRLTLSSVEMQSLYKALDLAQSEGIDITMVAWGCHKWCSHIIDKQYRSNQKYFLAEENSTEDWCIPSKQLEEWAESISALLQHLILERKYSCIKALTLINEPSWSYRIDGVVDAEHYTKMCHVVDERLKRDGVRDKLRFDLSDDAENINFLQHATRSVDDIADSYNSHTYKFGYETPNSQIEAWERANIEVVAPTGKPHFIGEFGSNQNVGASRQRDIDRYERGVLMARIALSLMNAGAAGVSYWSMVDQYYAFTDSYESMQHLGLWRSAKSEYQSEPYYDDIKQDFEPRAQYWAYSLLTRHIGKSEIYPLKTGNEFVAASAFRNEQDKWVYVIANGSDEKFAAQIENQALHRSRFSHYGYSKSKLPQSDCMIETDKVLSSRKGVLDIEVEAQSMAVFVEK